MGLAVSEACLTAVGGAVASQGLLLYFGRYKYENIVDNFISSASDELVQDFPPPTATPLDFPSGRVHGFRFSSLEL